MPIMTSSPTRLPASIVALATSPRPVPAWTASRRMSPVEIFGSPCVLASRSACVPLPAPGGPSITTFIALRSAPYDTWLPTPPANPCLLHEPVVVPHDQLRLDLLHRVHGDADDDQERRPAEEELNAEALSEEPRQRRIEPFADHGDLVHLEP